MTERRQIMEDNKARFDKYILYRYFQEYLPADKVTDDVIYKTSQQIQDELSEMADITINEIAETMVDLGYDLAISPEGRPSWIMLRK